jgi:oligogalacturonide transport system permease protein
MKRSNGRTLLTHLFLALSGLVFIYPVFWWFGAAFKTNDEMNSPSIFPAHLLWSNFTGGWGALPRYSFTHFYLNTFSLVVVVVIAAVIACSLTAYGFARLDFPLRNFWFSILILTLMLPSQVLIVPQYIMFNTFGWVDSYLPFYIPQILAAGNGSAFFIFLLVQFFRGVPHELDEAAKIDGCNWFSIYWRIMLPLAKSALVSVVIFAFLWNWDDFFAQLLYITSLEKYTVGLALKSFIDSESAAPWGQLLAMSLVSVMPATLIFFFAQRYFVEGIATGAIKG